MHWKLAIVVSCVLTAAGAVGLYAEDAERDQSLPAAESVSRSAGPTSTSLSKASADAERAAELTCGRNSLYLFLVLLGEPAPYSRLEELVPSRPEGTSILELRDAANRLGTGTAIYQIGMAELAECPKPVIAYFDRPPFSNPQDPNSQIGHFVVVLGVHERGVSVLGGRYGTRAVFRLKTFEDHWTGHILAPARTGSRWLNGAIMASVILCTAAGAWWWWRTRGRPNDAVQGSIPASVPSGQGSLESEPGISG